MDLWADLSGRTCLAGSVRPLVFMLGLAGSVWPDLFGFVFEVWPAQGARESQTDPAKQIRPEAHRARCQHASTALAKKFNVATNRRTRPSSAASCARPRKAVLSQAGGAARCRQPD